MSFRPINYHKKVRAAAAAHCDLSPGGFQGLGVWGLRFRVFGTGTVTEFEVCGLV